MAKEKGESEKLMSYNINIHRLQGLIPYEGRENVRCPDCQGNALVTVTINEGEEGHRQFSRKVKKRIFISCTDRQFCFGARSQEDFESRKEAWRAFMTGRWTPCPEYSFKILSERSTTIFSQRQKTEVEEPVVQQLRKKQ